VKVIALFEGDKPVKVGGRARQADLATALTVSKSFRQRSKGTSSASLIYTFDKAALQIEGTRESE
jgi:hypothetical protein